MFKRAGDGVSVEVSLRLLDGTLLIGSVNCGMAGRIESLLSSDIKFVEFVSKQGQQRFIAHHQIASVELLASLAEPTIAAVSDDAEPFGLLGITPASSMAEAMSAFQTKLAIYSPERWAAGDVPFEFSRFAAQKSRQFNAAFTAVKSALQEHEAQVKAKEAETISAIGRRPLFGSGGDAA